MRAFAFSVMTIAALTLGACGEGDVEEKPVPEQKVLVRLNVNEGIEGEVNKNIGEGWRVKEVHMND
ncbi:MAG: hypothetical protein KDB68_17615, partial [Planctomycetes bacterium]|nr:hypothetical protein [Planctomycetota bacterium]